MVTLDLVGSSGFDHFAHPGEEAEDFGHGGVLEVGGNHLEVAHIEVVLLCRPCIHPLPVRLHPRLTLEPPTQNILKTQSLNHSPILRLYPTLNFEVHL